MKPDKSKHLTVARFTYGSYLFNCINLENDLKQKKSKLNKALEKIFINFETAKKEIKES